MRHQRKHKMWLDLAQLGLSSMTPYWLLPHGELFFAPIKSLTVALGTQDWISPTLAHRSARACTAAYCSAPTKLLSCVVSAAVMRLWGWFLLCFGISKGEIFSIYSTWSYSILLSSHCWNLIPVKVNDPFSNEPKLNLSLIRWSEPMNTWLPPPIPSSTWMPRDPWTRIWLESLVDSVNTHGSREQCVSKFAIPEVWRIYPAISPTFQATLVSFRPSRWIPKSRPSPSPCKKAVETSKEMRSQPKLLTCWRTIWRPSLLKVGESFLTMPTPGSSKQMTKSLALAFWPLLTSAGRSVGPAPFQERIRLHRITADWGIFPLATFRTVECVNQAPISLCFATAIRSWSALLRVLSLISTFCFWASDTSNTLSSADASHSELSSCFGSRGSLFPINPYFHTPQKPHHPQTTQHKHHPHLEAPHRIQKVCQIVSGIGTSKGSSCFSFRSPSWDSVSPWDSAGHSPSGSIEDGEYPGDSISTSSSGGVSSPSRSIKIPPLRFWEKLDMGLTSVVAFSRVGKLFHSRKLAGRICSGDARTSRPLWLSQTLRRPSTATALAGPNHLPLSP